MTHHAPPELFSIGDIPHVPHTKKARRPGNLQDQLQITFATRMLRDGVPIEVVSKLLGHSCVTTTSSVYGHLTVEDARQTLEDAGWLTGREVRL